MATAAKRKSKAPRSQRRLTPIEQAQQAHRAKVHRDWCARHPRLAAAERETRQQVREQDAQYDFDNISGTPETLAKARRVSQGGLARLYRTGTIDLEQLAASLEIVAAHESIIRSVGGGSTWTFDRVDCSSRPSGIFFEALGAVRSEVAYSRWRKALPEPLPVLAMIVEDIGLAGATQRFSMHKRRAKRLLIEALDLWTRLRREACKEVDEATLLAAQAGVLS